MKKKQGRNKMAEGWANQKLRYEIFTSTLIVTAIFGLGSSATGTSMASHRDSSGVEAQRITLQKGYRMWVDKQCKEFLKGRANTGKTPNIGSPEKFEQNGQDYADREEAVEKLLYKMIKKIKGRKAPNDDTAKGIKKWLDALEAWSAANERLIALIRQGELDFGSFAQRYAEVQKLKIKARKQAKRLGLKEGGSI